MEILHHAIKVTVNMVNPTMIFSVMKKQCGVVRGKGLGGSSNLNSLQYARGNRDDYNNWARQGCKGWDYDSVLPYFIKAEANTNSRFLQSGTHDTASD